MEINQSSSSSLRALLWWGFYCRWRTRKAGLKDGGGVKLSFSGFERQPLVLTQVLRWRGWGEWALLSLLSRRSWHEWALFQKSFSRKVCKVATPDTEFVKGIPTALAQDFYFDVNKQNLIVFDDQMIDASKDKRIVNVFTRGSHHRN